jgi:hypothetical protein
MPDPHVEQVLLTVASGSGMAPLPESVAERYGVPRVRFVLLGREQPTFVTVVVTRRDSEHMPTVAFVRAVSAVPKPRTLGASADPVRSADHGRHSDQAQSDTR